MIGLYTTWVAIPALCDRLGSPRENRQSVVKPTRERTGIHVKEAITSTGTRSCRNRQPDQLRGLGFQENIRRPGSNT